MHKFKFTVSFVSTSKYSSIEPFVNKVQLVAKEAFRNPRFRIVGVQGCSRFGVLFVNVFLKQVFFFNYAI